MRDRIPKDWPHRILYKKSGEVAHIAFYCVPFKHDNCRRVEYVDLRGIEGPGCFLAWDMYYEGHRAADLGAGPDGKRFTTIQMAVNELARRGILPARELLTEYRVW
jgi:hypothetical protein